MAALGRALPVTNSVNRSKDSDDFTPRPQNLYQLLGGEGFDGAFTGACAENSATGRCVAVADTVNGNDAARPAPCVSAKGKTTVDRTPH